MKIDTSWLTRETVGLVTERAKTKAKLKKNECVEKKTLFLGKRGHAKLKKKKDPFPRENENADAGAGAAD